MGVLLRDVVPVAFRLVDALKVPLLQGEGVLGLVLVLLLALLNPIYAVLLKCSHLKTELMFTGGRGIYFLSSQDTRNIPGLFKETRLRSQYKFSSILDLGILGRKYS